MQLWLAQRILGAPQCLSEDINVLTDFSHCSRICGLRQKPSLQDVVGSYVVSHSMENIAGQLGFRFLHVGPKLAQQCNLGGVHSDDLEQSLN